ncbi:MAG: MBL fold metallo-hydrolase [Phycisphaerae bacterium]|nr:MBL fold metallo-hydrolase [Phycisphaerae bacterium]
MRIRCCGAAGQVTGSGYLIETDEATILVDFGTFAGEANEDAMNRALGFLEPARLDAVLVTHAHGDHIGRLPMLTKNGYRGPIYATSATVDIGTLMLADSARIQQSDVERENRRAKQAGRPTTEALFDSDDAEALVPLTRQVRLDVPTQVAKGITARWFEAGHILGSASIELSINEGSTTKTVVFSGDLGPRGSPILSDFAPPTHADLVFLESTYGDRDHPPRDETVRHFIEVLRDAMWAHGRVIIPAFAVGRTQTILFHIAQAIRDGTLPEFPIYLDAPMASKVTAVYQRHQDLYDAEMSQMARAHEMSSALRRLEIVESSLESRALNDSRESCLVIAGSGMCEGGRILHHLMHGLPRRDVTVITVGYMARGTLGRKLLEQPASVEIFGEDVPVRARIEKIDGLSAHAGRSELIEWFAAVATSKPQLMITHGDDMQRASLRDAIASRFGLTARLPLIGEPIEL